MASEIPRGKREGVELRPANKPCSFRFELVMGTHAVPDEKQPGLLLLVTSGSLHHSVSLIIPFGLQAFDPMSSLYFVVGRHGSRILRDLVEVDSRPF